MFLFEDQQGISASQDFEKEVQELRAKVNSILQLSAGHQAATVSGSAVNPMFPATSVGGILCRLQAVETRVSTKETCILSSSTFASVASSVGEYVTTHAVPSCAMLWDLFSVIVCMSDQGVTSKERLDEIYSAEKGKKGFSS